MGFGNVLWGAAVSESQVVAPWEMIALSDTGTQFVLDYPRFGCPVGMAMGDAVNQLWPYASNIDPFSNRIQHPPQHGRNFSVLFSDAHVSSMSANLLMRCSNSASMWNYDHKSHREGWAWP